LAHSARLVRLQNSRPRLADPFGLNSFLLPFAGLNHGLPLCPLVVFFGDTGPAELLLKGLPEGVSPVVDARSKLLPARAPDAPEL
jgi:hypothetical protein